MPKIYFTPSEPPYKPRRPQLDLTDQRFGKLTVIRAVGFYLVRVVPPRNRTLIWECQCDCGKTAYVNTWNLSGKKHTTSCGCAFLEKVTTHGLSQEPPQIYRAWQNMKNRVRPGVENADHYYERGITICEEWLNSFERFAAHVGKPPTEHHSLDRINNDRGYEPGNVRWATLIEQARNKSNNTLIEINGQTRCLAEWAHGHGIKLSTACTRIARGWAPHDAVTIPPNGSQRKRGPKSVKADRAATVVIETALPSSDLIQNQISAVSIKLIRYPAFIVLE